MLLSIEFLKILSHFGKLSYGLLPVKLPPNGRYGLIIKIGKEAILTARLNRQIKIYFVPDLDVPGRVHGFITVFFDDHDEPLSLFTPLFAEDALATDLARLLEQGVSTFISSTNMIERCLESALSSTLNVLGPRGTAQPWPSST